MKRKSIIISIFFAIFLLLLNIKSYAGTQKWNSLNYNVELTSSGDMCVEETWDIDISNTNTLFKTLKIDPSKDAHASSINISEIKYYCGIENVRVTEIRDGQEISLNQIYEQQYHVDKGSYYAMPISDSEFEIAWNVGLDNSSGKRIYKLCYTIENAIKIYDDCTELYWQFLGKNNSISGKNITGTIKLPKEVRDIENLRVWAHGPLSGKINKISKTTVEFSVPELQKNTMLEVRIVTDENIYEECTNVENSNKLNSILEEEQTWADEANAERNKYRLIYVMFIIILIVIIYYFLKKIIKYKRMKKELLEKYYIENEKIKYYREIPNEKVATPARAIFLYCFKNDSYDMDKYSSKIFTATLLDLSLKGLINFDAIDSKEFKIILNKSKDKELPRDEEGVYNILKHAIEKQGEGRDYITTKEFSQYTKVHHKDLYNVMRNFETAADNYHFASGNIDSKKEMELNNIKGKISGHQICVILLMFFMFFIISALASGGVIEQYLIPIFAIVLAIFIGNFWCINILNGILKKTTMLSEKGNLEKIEWNALKKYMEDFSLLEDKLVPDIVLWEKFLVYATAFGISKKVIKQLKVTYPEMFEERSENYYGRYAYWNVVSDSNFSENMFSGFSSNMERNYQNAITNYRIATSSSSSGSGSGGGFSSGGGGRRTAEAAAVEDK